MNCILHDLLSAAGSAIGGAIGAVAAFRLQDRTVRNRTLASAIIGIQSFMDRINEEHPDPLRRAFISEMRPTVLGAISNLNAKKQAHASKAWEACRTLDLNHFPDESSGQRMGETFQGGKTSKINALYQVLKALKEALD